MNLTLFYKEGSEKNIRRYVVVIPYQQLENICASTDGANSLRKGGGVDIYKPRIAS